VEERHLTTEMTRVAEGVEERHLTTETTQASEAKEERQLATGGVDSAQPATHSVKKRRLEEFGSNPAPTVPAQSRSDLIST